MSTVRETFGLACPLCGGDDDLQVTVELWIDLWPIRSTTAEKARWEREADRHKLSLSEFVRIKLNNGKVRVATAADPALLDELRRQGNNLNQMMHAINAGHFIHPSRVEAVLEALQNLYRQQIGRP